MWDAKKATEKLKPKVKAELGKLEQRIARIEHDIATLTGQQVNHKHEHLEQRIARLEDRLEQVECDLPNNWKPVTDEKPTYAEGYAQGRFDEKFKDMNGKTNNPIAKDECEKSACYCYGSGTCSYCESKRKPDTITIPRDVAVEWLFEDTADITPLDAKLAEAIKQSLGGQK